MAPAHCKMTGQGQICKEGVTLLHWRARLISRVSDVTAQCCHLVTAAWWRFKTRRKRWNTEPYQASKTCKVANICNSKDVQKNTFSCHWRIILLVGVLVKYVRYFTSSHLSNCFSRLMVWQFSAYCVSSLCIFRKPENSCSTISPTPTYVFF